MNSSHKMFEFKLKALQMLLIQCQVLPINLHRLKQCSLVSSTTYIQVGATHVSSLVACEETIRCHLPCEELELCKLVRIPNGINYSLNFIYCEFEVKYLLL
jgi:hypothetical protein